MLALTAIPLLAGCAGDSATAAAPQTAPGRETNTRFDGWYRGQQLPVSASMSCPDRPRTVWFRVEKGWVEMRTARHRRSATQRPLLTGTVSAGGELALGGDLARHTVTGRIEGEHLTASVAAGRLVQRSGQASCLHRYEAIRRETMDED